MELKSEMSEEKNNGIWNQSHRHTFNRKSIDRITHNAPDMLRQKLWLSFRTESVRMSSFNNCTGCIWDVSAVLTRLFFFSALVFRCRSSAPPPCCQSSHYLTAEDLPRSFLHPRIVQFTVSHTCSLLLSFSESLPELEAVSPFWGFLCLLSLVPSPPMMPQLWTSSWTPPLPAPPSSLVPAFIFHLLPLTFTILSLNHLVPLHYDWFQATLRFSATHRCSLQVSSSYFLPNSSWEISRMKPHPYMYRYSTTTLR